MKELIFNITDELLDNTVIVALTKSGKELIRCKDCIKKELCSIYRDARQEYGFCAWAERKEE